MERFLFKYTQGYVRLPSICWSGFVELVLRLYLFSKFAQRSIQLGKETVKFVIIKHHEDVGDDDSTFNMLDVGI